MIDRFNTFLIGILVGAVILSLIIAVSAHAEEIYCPDCDTPLYEFTQPLIRGITTDNIMPDDFIPLSMNIKKFTIKDKLNCPLCTAPLNGYLYPYWKKRLPLPKLVYPALTLKTKDGWKPYQFSLEE